jgi:hypothetical protein
MKDFTKIQRYLLLASFIGTFAEQMILPLYSMFVAHIGGGVLDAGVGFAIFSILTGLVIIGTGKISWFNKNTALIVMLGFFIAGIGDFSYFFVTNTIGLFLVQAINGIAVGLLNPAWEAIYTQEGEDGKEHELWSFWGGGANIATGLAALFGAGVTYLFGFKAMFISTALFNLISVYYAYMVYKNRKALNG